MTGGVDTALRPARAHVTGPGRQAAAALVTELRHALGPNVATAVLFFASSVYDPTDLAGPISQAFPDAAVIGCSTAGEFTDQVMGTGGISAVALPYGILTGAVAALGDLSMDAAAGTWSAVHALEASLEIPLRELDPSFHLGFTLIDGVNAVEETVNEVLGNVAPVLDVVGASAADDLTFRSTWVSVGEHISYRGVALMVCQTGVPFHVVKTCSFLPTGRTLRITDADPPTRTVRTLDGRPAVLAFADAIGVPVDRLDGNLLISHPLGQMIDGQPWIRCPQAVLPDGSITFYAQVLPGLEVEVMQETDLIADTRRAIAEARTALGGQASGGVMFNCLLRRLEIDARQAGPSFLQALDGLPLAGFHAYGETWLGHVNQTLTGIVFG
ncbi:MAG TPA: FIST N-terminal domain-containing protein [Kineosporiaceae bacterium]